MKRRRITGLVAMLFLIAACRREALVLSSSRYGEFGNATLVTQFYKARPADEERALFHILFVPLMDRPLRYGYGGFMAGGGSVRELQFHYSYEEFSGMPGKVSIHAQPLYVRNLTTVEAAGFSSVLSKGSVFVAHVHLDGSLQVTQLPIMAQEYGSEPNAVLATIKGHLPADKHVQHLPSGR